MKKSILFIVDKPNWAYNFIVKTWVELLTDFECYIAFGKDYQICHRKFNTLDVKKNICFNIKDKTNQIYLLDINISFYNTIYSSF